MQEKGKFDTIRLDRVLKFWAYYTKESPELLYLLLLNIYLNK